MRRDLKTRVRCAQALLAACVLLWALMALSAAGCTPPKILEWQCPVPPTLALWDTRTVYTCPADGRSITITHPARP